MPWRVGWTRPCGPARSAGSTMRRAGGRSSWWRIVTSGWQLDRLTRAGLACLVDRLAPPVDRALTAYLHLDLLGQQAVLDTAADAVDALQELFDAALVAWRVALDLDAQATVPTHPDPDR